MQEESQAERRQSRDSLCSSIGSRRYSAKDWRVFQALFQPANPVTLPANTNRRPLLASAISLDITEEALAERLDDQFTQAPPVADAQLHVLPATPRIHE